MIIQFDCTIPVIRGTIFYASLRTEFTLLNKYSIFLNEPYPNFKNSQYLVIIEHKASSILAGHVFINTRQINPNPTPSLRV